jgi:hypothetical protein
VSRHHYLHTIVRLYLEQPGAPPRASRHDWAVAQVLYHSDVPLEHVLHAIRLAALRRLQHLGPPLPPVRNLAYYSQVLAQLTTQERERDYVRYVASHYRDIASPRRASDSQNRALSDRR